MARRLCGEPVRVSTRESHDKKRNPLTIGDWAGIANLCVAVTAIIVSLLVFSRQSQSESATSKVLIDSRNSLVTATKELGVEQNELNKVTVDLVDADSSLRKLESHASDEVRQLDAADAALKRMLNTANAQYGMDNRILGVSKSQYGLLRAQHAAQIAAQSASPSIGIDLQYVNGATLMYERTSAIARGLPFEPQIGPEADLVFHVLLSNRGTAAAISPVVIITAQELDIGGCTPIFPHSIQCGQNTDLLIGQEYFVPFIIVTPKTAGVYEITIQVLTRNQTGSFTRFVTSRKLYLKPAPH